ncbi:anti-sigma-D factor RsdA [Jongsikchunia kroppenstedtii]|uniref:anti-sigma-D factor RsdA n=1 Tax=Jongsikchunia kroppenstedtii TaxID=1121721 RepID=UPI00035C9748|nr:anti-sigma-D factor RsdA [Jongsikchunia kroppenstedtii]
MTDKFDDFLSGEDATPFDLSAVYADDQLIEALRTDGYVATQSDQEYELASLLAGWRIDAGATPMPAEPTLEQVEAEIQRVDTRARHHRRMRRLQVVSGAAAAIAIAIGGVTIAAHDASPGSALWGVKQVMFSKAAAETTNMAAAQEAASSATAAISRGDRSSARQYLNALQDRASKIHDDDHRQKIESQIDVLRNQLDSPTTPTAPTVTSPLTIPTLPWTNMLKPPSSSHTVPSIPVTPPTLPTLPPTVTLPTLPLPTESLPTVTVPTVTVPTATIPTVIPTLPPVTIPPVQPGAGVYQLPTIPTYGGL